MAVSIQEALEVVSVSRPTLMKAINENKTKLRPYLKKGRKNSYRITKTGLRLIAEMVGKPLADRVEVPEEIVEATQTTPFEELSAHDQILHLKVMVDTLVSELERERRERRKLSREIKNRDKRKAKAMQELFPMFFEAAK